jgi:DNA polymerase-3 subunit alpha
MFSIQNYTAYSMDAGIAIPKKWLEIAKLYGYKAMSFTDRSTMAGSIKLQSECDALGILPIHGMDVYFCKSAAKTDSNKNPDGRILLYAKNKKGFHNLIQLNNLSKDPNGSAYYYRPRIPLNLLALYCEDLICVVAQDGGHKILADQGLLGALHSLFQDDFYIGVNPLVDLKTCVDYLDNAPKYNFIFTFNAITPFKDQKDLYHDLAVMDNGPVKRNIHNSPNPGYLVDPSVVLSWFSEDHQNKINAIFDKFYSKVENFLVLGKYEMPKPDCQDVQEFLSERLVEGFRKKLMPSLPSNIKNINDLSKLDLEPYYSDTLFRRDDPDKKKHTLQVYFNRLVMEFETIANLGFLDYFYHVWDICYTIDQAGFDRGPARGSAGGSVASYLLNITMIDPVKFDLPFVRFLNPQRKDLPDIDLDMPEEAREYVKNYLKKKYGDDHVCDIGTYSRLRIKSAIKDLAASKSYGIPDNNNNIVHYEIKYLDNLLDIHAKATARGDDELEELLNDPAFVKFYDKHANWFLDHVFPLLDCVRAESMHAAGAVITPKQFNECIPLNYNSRQKTWSTQWEMMDVELYGYPKFDLLVVNALNVISDAKTLIKKYHGVTVPSYDDIPIDDAGALEVFKKVETSSIFQYNTFSQKRFLSRFETDSFDDLAAAIALVRPGPIAAQADTKYANKKNGTLKVQYDHPDEQAILGKTYGELVYQEQMMKIAVEIAGFTGVESEALRKACGKKKIADMNKWQETFMKQGQERGYEEAYLSNLWHKIVSFAEYSFNLSHSVGYAMISYYQAYIKSRYPVEYWTATLAWAKTSSMKKNTVYDLKVDAEKEGIHFIFPNCNGFAAEFTPAGLGAIYWPLSVVKFVGQSALDRLTLNGNRNSFDSMDDFFAACKESVTTTDENGKTTTKNVTHINKRVVHALIRIGFFNPWCPPWVALKKYNEFIALTDKKKEEAFPDDLLDINGDPIKDFFFWQKERNDAFSCQVESWKSIAPFDPAIQTFSEQDLNAVPDGESIFIGGEVKLIRRAFSKDNKPRAMLIIEDGSEKYFVNCWDEFWSNVALDREKRRPREGDLIELVVKKKTWNDRASLEISRKDAYCRIVARKEI